MADGRDPRLTRPSLGVLRAFLERPQHELAGADLQKLTGLQSGTLYPILLRFEDAGWLTSSWEDVDPHTAHRPRRRYYKLTGMGIVKSRAVFEQLRLTAKEEAWVF